MLRAGDWVEVRSRDEILRTLDKQGRLGGLPFMPQMFRYCGRRFQVYKRAHKTCDTIHPPSSRALEGGIHLDLRCDGIAYGGCQAACLIFWKEAWLKPLAAEQDSTPPAAAQPAGAAGCTEMDIWRATRAEGDIRGEIRYRCQATDLPSFTTPLSRWDIRQYWTDYQSGNVELPQIASAAAYSIYRRFARLKYVGPFLVSLYDRFQRLRGGTPFPIGSARRTVAKAVSKAPLDLKPGEWVRVKSFDDILATVDAHGKDRGLLFDAELVPFCGKVYRVRSRIDQFIEESTGRMIRLKTPAVMLENVWCLSRYSNHRAFCPRSIYSWWRESWLERVSDVPSEIGEAASVKAATPKEHALSRTADG